MAPSRAGTRRRVEVKLVQRYAEWMAQRGHTVVGREYPVTGEARPLRCDAFVEDVGLLVEAKRHDDRNSIRLAIGQLMDYLRFEGDVRLAVLVPHELAPDHQALLRSVGVDWIWLSRRGGFSDSAGGLLTR